MPVSRSNGLAATGADLNDDPASGNETSATANADVVLPERVQVVVDLLAEVRARHS